MTLGCCSGYLTSMCVIVVNATFFMSVVDIDGNGYQYRVWCIAILVLTLAVIVVLPLYWFSFVVTHVHRCRHEWPSMYRTRN